MDYDELEDEENRTLMKEWILSTFKRRECVKILKSKVYSEKCGCGRRIDEHTSKVNLAGSIRSLNRQTITTNDEPAKSNDQQQQQPELWKIKDNTQTFATNAFGTLEFQGADIYTAKAEYIRLSFDTKPQDIIKLMKNYWQLEMPKLIISVHGGIANFGLQSKLKQAIQRGLIKVANTSHIWIITAGTDTGVVKHIGDILRDYFPRSRNNVIVIGIAPWGVVNERDSLIGTGIEVAYYSNHATFNSNNGFYLNNCHSYFLLVDDGTCGKYGCEISFRRRLERFLSRHKTEIFLDFEIKPNNFNVKVEEKITFQNHSIPLVCLVIEGGTNTIQTVLVNVNDKPPVPVVICDGSGRAADLIAFTHRYVNINPLTKKATIAADIKEQLIMTIMRTFNYTKEQADYLFVQLMNCVNNKDLISIYRLGENDNQEIDMAILTASLKVIDLDLNKQFDIIMSWNRPDIARKYIMLDGSRTEKHILEEKMFEALSNDKLEFVKLLLEYGVNLTKFLTYKRLQDLYNCKKGPPNTLILIVKDVVKRIDHNYRISLLDIGLVIEKLIGNGYMSEYSKKEFKTKYVNNELINKHRSGRLDNHNATHQAQQEVFKYPYHELLIWAVLMKRQDMAMFFCKRGEEVLAKALVAVKLNKALAREAELDDLDSEISDQFKKYSDEFATLACGFLEKCYKENDMLTSQLLTYDLVNWGNWTCLSFAISANLKDFISHPACQLLISDLWMGGMKIRKYVTIKVIAAILFPPAIFAIQFKSAKELQYMPQTQEEHEQELENQDSFSDDSSDQVENQLETSQQQGHPDKDENTHINAMNNFPMNQLTISSQQRGADVNDTSAHMLSLDHIIEMYDAQNYQPIQGSGGAGTNGEVASKKNNKELLKLLNDEEHVFEIPQEKKTFNYMVRNSQNKLKFGKKIYEFYNAPITKFWQNVIIYIIFLICFAYIVLVKTPTKPSPEEIFVLVYIFTYGFDKIREFLQTDSPRFSGKIKIFFGKLMNLLDIFFILSIILALVFRLVPTSKSQTIPRLIYCVNTIYWVVKLLEFLIINKYTGPLIIIASRMLIDLFNFVVILLIILLSFGLSRQAIKFPDEEFKWELVKNIFLEPYFMLYGEVYADTIDPPCNMTSGPNEPECQPGHWITPITMTVFMVIACLLLLTVLIASFNNTFIRISSQSAMFWKCQRYHIVTAFESKPLLPPPLVPISHVFMIIKYFIRLCQRKTIKFDRKLKSFLSDEMIQRLNDFEEDCFYEYSCDLEMHTSNLMENKVNMAKTGVDNISTRIDDIFFKENMTKLSLYKVELRLQKLEEFNHEIYDKLNMLSEMMVKKNVVSQRNSSEWASNNQSSQNRLRRVTMTSDEPSSFVDSSNLNKRATKSRKERGGDVHDDNAPTQSDSNGSKYLRKRRVRDRFLSEAQYLPNTNVPTSFVVSGGAGSASLLNSKRANEMQAAKLNTFESNQVMEDQENYIIADQSDDDNDDNEKDALNFNTETAESRDKKQTQVDMNSEFELKFKTIVASQSGTSEQENQLNKDSRQEKREEAEKEEANVESEDDEDDDEDGEEEGEEEEEDAEKKILKKIYKEAVKTNRLQNKLMQSSQTPPQSLDQCTLHPFIYLHSVVKPPLAEYTSITDCIDTTNIDRPPSPEFYNSYAKNSGLSQLLNKVNSKSKEASSAAHAQMDDYCTTESARSIVARQESEILRLAEESQHVIISEMFNKLVKPKSLTDTKSASVGSAIRADPSGSSDAGVIDLPTLESAKIFTDLDNRELIDNAHFTLGSESPTSIADLNEDKEKRKDSTQSAELNALNKATTNQTSSKETSPSKPIPIYKKQDSIGSKSSKNAKFDSKKNADQPITPTSSIPLNPIDRKSSQIFYAQSHATVLSQLVDDDTEKEDKL